MRVNERDTLAIIGANIRGARQNIGWTQAKLALQAGTNKGHISKIEHGGNATLLTFYRIARALCVSPAHLLPPNLW